VASSVHHSPADSEAEGGGNEADKRGKTVRNRFRSCVEEAHTPLNDTGLSQASKMLQVDTSIKTYFFAPFNRVLISQPLGGTDNVFLVQNRPFVCVFRLTI
jgi:hypothetical protein